MLDYYNIRLANDDKSPKPKENRILSLFRCRRLVIIVVATGWIAQFFCRITNSFIVDLSNEFNVVALIAYRFSRSFSGKRMAGAPDNLPAIATRSRESCTCSFNP